MVGPSLDVGQVGSAEDVGRVQVRFGTAAVGRCPRTGLEVIPKIALEPTLSPSASGDSTVRLRVWQVPPRISGLADSFWSVGILWRPRPGADRAVRGLAV